MLGNTIFNKSNEIRNNHLISQIVHYNVIDFDVSLKYIYNIRCKNLISPLQY